MEKTYLSATLTHLPAEWQAVLAEVLASPAFAQLDHALWTRQQAGAVIYPPREQIFTALTQTPLSAVKVVILGQDPYHGEGEAHGLAFSVPKGKTIPPSLRNIFKEIQSDIGLSRFEHGDLTAWAQQGVLLLNTALTVEKDCANAHSTLGWAVVTEAVVAAISQQARPCVFMLWGASARRYAAKIAPQHDVLESLHPSPLSAWRGFFGCRHFSKANAFLQEQGRGAIDWQN